MSEALERAAEAIHAVNPMVEGGEYVDGFKVSPDQPLRWSDVVEGYPLVAEEMRSLARAALLAFLEKDNAEIRTAMARAMRFSECDEDDWDSLNLADQFQLKTFANFALHALRVLAGDQSPDQTSSKD